MATLMRKNLMIEDEKLKELARRRGLSESETVRQLIDFALMADEVNGAIDELRALGGIDDVFERLPKDVGAFVERAGQAQAS